MFRIFLSLVVADVLVLLGAGILGLSAENERGAARHLGLGVFASILTCLIHAVAFTYFTATGKMMRQAINLGQLDARLDREIRGLKQRVGRAVAPAILTCIATVATGAVATRVFGTSALSPASWHLLAAGVMLLVNVAAFVAEADLIARNRALMDGVFSSYQRVREQARAAAADAPRNGPPGGQESTEIDAPRSA